jgi:hypothetical protein
MNRRRLAVLLLLVGAAVGFGARLDDMALRDSMMAKGPLLGHRWLEKNGLEDYLLRQSWKPTADSGLACVGRWSYGPSLKVSLRVTADDTIICLTRGSGASLIRFRSQDSVTLDLLGDVNFAGIPRRAILSDTLVIAGIHSGGTGLEVHGVSNPAQPNLLSRVDLPVVNDIAVKDSLVYVACEDDTLRIYNIANPRLPVLVGSCCDSCDLFMTQAGNYCYLVHVSGVNIVDVSNPASPHRAGHIGGEPLAVYVRDTLCYVTLYQNGLCIYDISDIGSPQLVGSLSRPDAMDLTMAATNDTMLYTSLLDAISVANPSSPVLVGHVDRVASGVAVLPAPSCALLAVDGLTAVDISNPASPRVDTNAFSAGSAVDIALDGTKAYVGSYHSGLAILDVANPASPVQLGGLDYVGDLPSCLSVEARDSFAYVCWEPGAQFRTVDVSNPRSPVLTGGDTLFDRPQDMVLRDSFVYAAMNRRLQIVNVARPREPVLVGSCVIQGIGVDLVLRDTLVYVSSLPTQVINVRDPAAPVIVGTIPTYGHGIELRDSFAFVPALYDSMVIYNVQNPAAPVRVGRHTFSGGHVWNSGVALVDRLLYVGGDIVHVVDVADPLHPVEVGTWIPPYETRRLCYAAPYLYAASYDAGVCILETVPTGLEESPEKGGITKEVRLSPSVTTGRIAVETRSGPGELTLSLYDASGAKVKELQASTARSGIRLRVELDLSGFPDGIYFVSLKGKDRSFTTKVVKTKGR